jgi:hypothetical protein
MGGRDDGQPRQPASNSVSREQAGLPGMRASGIAGRGAALLHAHS